MRNKGLVIGLVGVMTMLFSFNGISQERRATIKKNADCVMIKRPLVGERQKQDVQALKPKGIRAKVDPKHLKKRMKASTEIKTVEPRPIKGTIRHKK